MDWVMDASLALAWALPDEKSAVADEFFRRSEAEEIRVPAIFWYEVSNSIAVSSKRGRLTPANARRLLELLSGLPFKTDALVGQPTLVPLEAAARVHGLSVYDAAYLDLAARKGLGLATLDEQLATAARQAGIPVFTSESDGAAQ